MKQNEKINNMSTEQKAEFFASLTETGACNNFEIFPSRKCDGNCKICLKEWLESEVKE